MNVNKSATISLTKLDLQILPDASGCCLLEIIIPSTKNEH